MSQPSEDPLAADLEQFLSANPHPCGETPDPNDHEVCSLAWAAIDGKAEPEELARLEQLIESGAGAKKAYQSVLALEHGLKAFFAGGESLPAPDA